MNQTVLLPCSTRHDHKQVLPQSHLGRARRYPHVGECTLPLRVLAVQCVTLQNYYRTLLKRYGSVMEALRIVT